MVQPKQPFNAIDGDSENEVGVPQGKVHDDDHDYGNLRDGMSGGRSIPLDDDDESNDAASDHGHTMFQKITQEMIHEEVDISSVQQVYNVGYT